MLGCAQACVCCFCTQVCASQGVHRCVSVGMPGMRPQPWGAYLQVGPVPGLLSLHLTQQRLQVGAERRPQLRLGHVLDGRLQRGPQGVDVRLQAKSQ